MTKPKEYNAYLCFFGCEEISDYLFERVEWPWMHDVMLACGELSFEDVALFRSSGIIDIGTDDVATSTALSSGCVPARSDTSGDTSTAIVVFQQPEEQEQVIAALKWATKVEELGVLLGLMRSLPEQVIKEQVRLYKSHVESTSAVAVVAVAMKVDVHPSKLSSRCAVAAAFDKYINKFWFRGRVALAEINSCFIYRGTIELRKRRRLIR